MSDNGGPTSTSRDAYAKHARWGKPTTQRARILALLKGSRRPLSRCEIARAFELPGPGGPPIPLASICGRVKVLIQAGQVRVDHVDEDPRSGHPVQYLAIADKPAQMDLGIPR